MPFSRIAPDRSLYVFAHQVGKTLRAHKYDGKLAKSVRLRFCVTSKVANAVELGRDSPSSARQGRIYNKADASSAIALGGEFS